MLHTLSAEDARLSSCITSASASGLTPFSHSRTQMASESASRPVLSKLDISINTVDKWTEKQKGKIWNCSKLLCLKPKSCLSTWSSTFSSTTAASRHVNGHLGLGLDQLQWRPAHSTFLVSLSLQQCNWTMWVGDRERVRWASRVPVTTRGLVSLPSSLLCRTWLQSPDDRLIHSCGW